MTGWTDFLDPEGPDGAYLPWKRVEPRVGISRTTAWRLQRSGDFPKPYVVSPGRVAYRESEVEAWKASRHHRPAETGRRTEPPRPAREPAAVCTEAEVTARSSIASEAPGVVAPQTPVADASQPSRLPRSDAGAGAADPGYRRSSARSQRRSASDQMTFDF